jgi:hypothetical protein
LKYINLLFLNINLSNSKKLFLFEKDKLNQNSFSNAFDNQLIILSKLLLKVLSGLLTV